MSDRSDKSGKSRSDEDLEYSEKEEKLEPDPKPQEPEERIQMAEVPNPKATSTVIIINHAKDHDMDKYCKYICLAIAGPVIIILVIGMIVIATSPDKNAQTFEDCGSFTESWDCMFDPSDSTNCSEVSDPPEDTGFSLWNCSAEAEPVADCYQYEDTELLECYKDPGGCDSSEGSHFYNCSEAADEICEPVEIACGRPYHANTESHVLVSKPILIANSSWVSHTYGTKTTTECKEVNGKTATAADDLVDISHLSEEQKRTLASDWTRDALYEHASIASFSKFVLDLMVCGAPQRLIKSALESALDETRHAVLCFTMADIYFSQSDTHSILHSDARLDEALDSHLTLFKPRDPHTNPRPEIGHGQPSEKLDSHQLSAGPFPEHKVLFSSDISRLALSTLREGCVGETIAVVKATVRSLVTMIPRISETLETIMDDEARHAALAWRTLQWAFSAEETDVRQVVEREVQNLKQTVERKDFQLRCNVDLKSEEVPESLVFLPEDNELALHGWINPELEFCIEILTKRYLIIPILENVLSRNYQTEQYLTPSRLFDESPKQPKLLPRSSTTMDKGNFRASIESSIYKIIRTSNLEGVDYAPMADIISHLMWHL